MLPAMRGPAGTGRAERGMTRVSGAVAHGCNDSLNGSPQKPKVQVKRQKTSLGWAYRIYIGGAYMGAALTLTTAREGANECLSFTTE